MAPSAKADGAIVFLFAKRFRCRRAKLKGPDARQEGSYRKGGGRRSYAESKPETVALAEELHGQRLSLSKFAAELAARGHLTASGRPYVASAVQEMSGQPHTSNAPAAICGAM